MGNKLKNKSKRMGRRRIKIRLADPNIPDSYVCEVFDSSLENEEEPNVLNCLNNKEKELPEEKDCKPKNYFEILMSKDVRKCGNFNSEKCNESIPEETKLLKVTESEKTSEKQRITKARNKEVLTHMVNSKKENNGLDIESSDDESLFQIQKKFNHKNILQNENSDFHSERENKNNLKNGKLDFKSPKKKSLNILNFFTKVGTPPDCHENSDIEEIKIVKNTEKTNALKGRSNNLNQDQKLLTLSSVNKENVKLAPLFQKKEKRVLDQATKKARLDFLFKGPPTVLKKTENKVNESCVNFPVISHIQQKDDSDVWKKREISLNFTKIIPVVETNYILDKNKKFSFSITNLNRGFSTVVNVESEITKDFLNLAKNKYSNLNLSLVIDGLKDKKNNFVNFAKEIEKKCQKSNDESSYELLNTLWTEKYKPKSSEILGNSTVVKKLGRWLQSWKSFDEQLKELIKSGKHLKNRERSDEDDDSDHFVSSDGESYGLRPPTNICILSGPNGCGKTTLVFALANEFEFSVLEVNASSKRTGKKVLSDLQEATQSHKVYRVNIFPNGAQETGTGKKTKKRRKKKNTKAPPKVTEPVSDCKISLILVEDSDIVFDEHDEGFVSAIQSLVQTSKRPIIFLTNDPNCGYLENLKTDESLVLEMDNPNFYKSCAVLDVVSCLEGGHINKEDIEPLLRHNNFDIRKSLMGLQFWVQPDKTSFILQQSFDLGQYWWGLCKFLYRQDLKHFNVSHTRKRKRMSDLFDSSDDESVAAKKIKINSVSSVPREFIAVVKKNNTSIQSYLNILEVASVLDEFRLPSNEEPTPAFEYKAKDSLSLEENMEEVCSNDLGEKLSEELVYLSTKVFSDKMRKVESEKHNFSFTSPSWEEIRWRKAQESASIEISALVPFHNGRDKKSIYLDYLPAVRNICRVERNRSTVNNKRTNRFKHYLNSLGIHLTESNLEINCEVFQH